MRSHGSSGTLGDLARIQIAPTGIVTGGVRGVKGIRLQS
jgi:hypothetical protein